MNNREWWEYDKQEPACLSKRATTAQLLLLVDPERYEHTVAIFCNLKGRLDFQVNSPDFKLLQLNKGNLKPDKPSVCTLSPLNLLPGKNSYNTSTYPLLPGFWETQE